MNSVRNCSFSMMFSWLAGPCAIAVQRCQPAACCLDNTQMRRLKLYREGGCLIRLFRGFARQFEQYELNGRLAYWYAARVTQFTSRITSRRAYRTTTNTYGCASRCGVQRLAAKNWVAQTNSSRRRAGCFDSYAFAAIQSTPLIRNMVGKQCSSRSQASPPPNTTGEMQQIGATVGE